jgi:peptide/nickel transport system permease protein
MDNDITRIYKKKSNFRMIWTKLIRSKTVIFGLIVLSILLFAAIFADVIANYDDVAIKQHMVERLQGPSAQHIFGTDSMGRDIFARVIHGARVSLVVGICTVLAAMLIGTIIGSIAAYYGGKVDNIIMRFMDIYQSIPPILLAISIVAAMGSSLINIMIALAVALVPGFSRIIRSSVLTVKEMEFIEAAKACGTSDLRIIYKHIIPNAIAPIIVQGTVSMGQSIMDLAALSFIGLGIEAPRPEWGSMLAEARKYLRQDPMLLLFPGIAIILTVLAMNLLGDGLRDSLDPKLRNN